MNNKSAEFQKGRGSQINKSSKFLKNSLVAGDPDSVDEPLHQSVITQYITEYPKKIVNKVESPDVSMMYSLNPYQGCEHGCIYCYARNTHQYWGYSAGLDFESKIIVKPDAPRLLEKFITNKKWEPVPITLSGNTDCYQPAERKFEITRKCLEVLLRYKHPVSFITKNSLILRDLDILTELAKMKLVKVMVSLTTLDEQLRLKLEPRTATASKRLNVMHELSKAGIACGVMTAPIIPGLNSMEIPKLIKAAADNGAVMAGYTMVRLNGDVASIFDDWIHKAFPDRAAKVLSLIKQCHGGKLNDSRWGARMKGDGNVADSIAQLFKSSVKKYMKECVPYEYDFAIFERPQKNCQLELF
jgi:DNA repair photolyase